MAGEGGEEGDAVDADAFFGGRAAGEPEAAVVERYDVDWTRWAGEGEEVLICGGPARGGEVAGVTVERDDGYGVGVGEEELEVGF